MTTAVSESQQPAESKRGDVILSAKNVVKHFPLGGGMFRGPSAVVRAVDGIDFELRRGETLGLVGESGSGKSTLGRLVLKLIEPTSGEVVFDGIDISTMKPKEVKPLRKRMQLVFQDPISSFNPRMTIEEVLTEPMIVHGIGNPKSRRERCKQLLDQVGLPEAALRRYPHQFSGGQAQRIGIARALTTDPDLLVCDEAVSALDVSVQAQVLNLLKHIQEELNLAYLFIAHDLNVVRYISDRICVMYLGKVVETGTSDEIMGDPKHPYTQALTAAIPELKTTGERGRQLLEGEIPSPTNPPSGCHFHTRCPQKFDRCVAEEPLLLPLGDTNRLAACHLYTEGKA